MEPLPPLDPPSRNGPQMSPVIMFRHPAYPRDLLRLSPVDGPQHDGVDYDCALISCGIVTGNTWATGWLATMGVGSQFVRVERPADGILREQKYYYFIDDHEPSYKYPIIPSFHHWRFPHDALPDLWKDFEIAPPPDISVKRKDEAVLARDNTCRMTGHKAAREVAHLVPLADGHWFDSNEMRRYCERQLEQPPVDDPRNRMVLRRDLHYLFDQRRFVFRTDELINMYHNRLPQRLSGIAVELVFARFAWALFTSQAFPLFDGLTKLAVRLFNPETTEINDRHLNQMDIRDKLKVWGPYRARSASPTKRSRSQAAEDKAYYGWESDQSASDDCELTGEPEEWPGRGRRRKRSWDEHLPPELVGSLGAHSPSSQSSHPTDDMHQGDVAAAVFALHSAHTKTEDSARPSKRVNIEPSRTTHLGRSSH
ncbi:hypothetical protein LRP88_00077 [Fusarium phalaenopsidis]